jgi:peptidoglycan/LPS O-acetylase OafA/YrhL
MVKLAEWGWLGVDLFFILSAFLVTHLLCTEKELYGKISLPKFYARRVLRIWPLFFLVLTVTCFVYPLFAPHKASHLYGAFLQHLVVPLYTFTGNFALPIHFGDMQNYAKASGLDFMVFVTLLCPFWSLCIEEQFYLLWGAAVRVLNSTRKLMICTGLLIMVGCLARFMLLSDRGTAGSTIYYMHSLWHLDTIMFGAMLAILLSLKPNFCQRLRNGWLPLLLTAASIAAFVSVIVFAPGIHSGDLALAPLMTVLSISGTLFLALVLHWQPLAKLLSLKWITHIGKLTFGMYVFHYSIVWFVRTVLNINMTGWNGVLSLCVSFALTFLAALISWHVLEKPMNDLRRKLSRVHIEPNAAAKSTLQPPAATEKQLALTRD